MVGVGVVVAVGVAVGGGGGGGSGLRVGVDMETWKVSVSLRVISWPLSGWVYVTVRTVLQVSGGH